MKKTDTHSGPRGVRCAYLLRGYILIRVVYDIKGIPLAKNFILYVIGIRQRAMLRAE